MIRSRNKHVCNPGARRSDGKPWKRKDKPKARILLVEKLPADYVPEVKEKTRKHIKPANYAVSEAIAKSSRSAEGKLIPRTSITSGSDWQFDSEGKLLKLPPKTLSHRKMDLTAIERQTAVRVANRIKTSAPITIKK